MPKYTITRTTKYPGGHPQDPGYRVSHLMAGDREFSVVSKPDGSNITRISSWSESAGRLTNLSAANRAKRAPEIEAAILQWVTDNGGYG